METVTRLIPGVRPPIHGGLDSQQTIPSVPLLLAIANDYRFTGGSKNISPNPVPQQYEFFPNQPDLRRYKNLDALRGQIIGPDPQFEGPTVVPTQPLGPLVLIISNDYRYAAGSPKQLEGQVFVPQQTYEFFPSQPDQARWALPRQNRFIVEATKQFEGPTIQQGYEFFPNQPDLARWTLPRQNRFVVDAVKRLEGPTQQQTYEFFPNQPEATRYERLRQELRFVVDVVKQLDGATTQQTYVFTPNQPEQSAWRRLQSPRYIVGATPYLPTTLPPTGQQTYEFVVSQPEQLRYARREQLRYVVDAIKQLEGAVSQQTYVFPLLQPDTFWPIALNRRVQPGHTLELFQAPPAIPQTYEFKLSQPELRWQPPRQFFVEPIRVEGPTVQASFEFIVSKPEMQRYALTQALRYQQASFPELHQAGSAIGPQTYEFKFNQPVMSRFDVLQVVRYQATAHPYWFGSSTTAYLLCYIQKL